MIIVMQKGASELCIQTVISLIRDNGLVEHISRGVERTIIGAVGDERVFDPHMFEGLDGVEKAMRIVEPWRIVSREVQAEDTCISVRGCVFGAAKQLTITEVEVGLDLSAQLPQGDVLYFDPCVQAASPYQIAASTPVSGWQELFSRLQQGSQPLMVRLRSTEQIDLLLGAGADILYLGSEFVDNRALLDAVRELNIPFVLEKGRQHTVQEMLVAAEYLALGGNHQLMFCEAGTLHFDPLCPLRLDVEAILMFKMLSHLPVLVNLCPLLKNRSVSPRLLKQTALATGVHGLISA